jgi:hypothetical protein
MAGELRRNLRARSVAHSPSAITLLYLSDLTRNYTCKHGDTEHHGFDAGRRPRPTLICRSQSRLAGLSDAVRRLESPSSLWYSSQNVPWSCPMSFCLNLQNAIVHADGDSFEKCQVR